jgi:hypothetical protein
MSPRLGEVVKQARQARRFTLRRLADHVMKNDATPTSPNTSVTSRSTIAACTRVGLRWGLTHTQGWAVDQAIPRGASGARVAGTRVTPAYPRVRRCSWRQPGGLGPARNASRDR